MGKFAQNINTSFPQDRVGPVVPAGRYLGRIVAAKDFDDVPAPPSWQNQNPRDIVRYLVALVDEDSGEFVGCVQSKEYTRSISPNAHICELWKAVTGTQLTTNDDSGDLVGYAVTVVVGVETSAKGNAYNTMDTPVAAGKRDAEVVPSLQELRAIISKLEDERKASPKGGSAAPAKGKAKAPKKEAPAPAPEVTEEEEAEEAPAAAPSTSHSNERDW